MLCEWQDTGNTIFFWINTPIPIITGKKYDNHPKPFKKMIIIKIKKSGNNNQINKY